MIRFADDNSLRYVKQMWKVCFNDPDEFIDLYFSEKYKNENTLIYFENNKPAASLQMLPYIFTFNNIEIPSAYISGACTLQEHRNKGYMKDLLIQSFKVMQDRNIPISILIPAESWLYHYYSKFGYEKVFGEADEYLCLEKIWHTADSNINKAYSDFDLIFRKKDFCVQKTKEDFITIYKDIKMDDFPAKANLPGMVRIINAKRLLSIFASTYPEKSFTIKLNDSIISKNNAIYQINKGSNYELSNSEDFEFELDIGLLCRLLFGYQLEKISQEISLQFEPHNPIMNLMLE